MKSSSKYLLEVQPIGGVGQIGSNMTLIKTPAQDVIIDSGILFPRDDFFDLNYLIPDLSTLKRAPTDIIITHGHEDHIGAIIHLIEKYPEIKLHAPPFAAGLLSRKFDYNDIEMKINIYDHSSVFNFKDIDIFPIHVNHSIPHTFGLLVRDKKELFSAFYVSDFKYDKESPYEDPMDLKLLKKLSQKSKKKILFADSTNILGESKTTSEGELIPVFEDIFTTTKKRIFVTAFSSNIHRMQTIINAAKVAKRKVIPCGKSVEKYLETANELNLVENYDKTIRPQKSVTNDDKNIVVLVSGCQGDFRSALRRIANSENPQFLPDKNDIFLFSSRTIPGNEQKVTSIINNLSLAKCQIITPSDKLIHASGHAGTEDLKVLYDAFKPDAAIPIHGESYFLQKHFDFIKENYPQTEPHLLNNFDSINLNKKLSISITENEPLNPVLIHGKRIPIETSSISQRRKIACNGAIFVSIKTDSIKKFCKVKMDYNFIGLPDLTEELSFQEHFTKLVTNHLKKNKIRSIDKTKEEVRILIRRFFNEKLGYKPITIIHFV